MFFESGDVVNKAYICVGQTVGLLHEVKGVKEVVDGVMSECLETIAKFN